MKRPGHKYLLWLCDEIVINVSFLLALTFRYGEPSVPVWMLFHMNLTFVLNWVVCNVIMLVLLVNGPLYKINISLSITAQIYQILRLLGYAGVSIAVISFIAASEVFYTSRILLFYYLGFCFVLLVMTRVVLFRFLFRKLSLHGLFPRRKMLLVGAGNSAIQLANRLSDYNPYGVMLVGICDNKLPGDTLLAPGVPVLGRLGDLSTIVNRHKIQDLVFCVEDEPDEVCIAILEECMSTKARVLVGAQQFNVINRYTIQEYYDTVPLFGLRNGKAYWGVPFLKNSIDFILALLTIVLLLPLLLIIAAAILIDSPGPIFFRQTRIGKNGKPFIFYKFRSMRIDCNDDAERALKLKNFIHEDQHPSTESTKILREDMVTPVGRFLRRTSLDELPQLFNVLKGDMSLVGPRPCLPYEWEQYSQWHRKRLSATPGCTGLWQVVARSRVSFRDMTIIDIFYNNNISFHLDTWLLLKTIPVMLFGSGGK